MKPLVLSLLFFSVPAIAVPPLTLPAQDIVGDWLSLRLCSEGLYKFTLDGKYRGYCWDTGEAGRWSLRNGNNITITHYDDLDKETVSAKSRRDTIIILRFERHSDRTFMYVRFHDREDKWMK